MNLQDQHKTNLISNNQIASTCRIFPHLIPCLILLTLYSNAGLSKELEEAVKRRAAVEEKVRVRSSMCQRQILLLIA